MVRRTKFIWRSPLFTLLLLFTLTLLAGSAAQASPDPVDNGSSYAPLDGASGSLYQSGTQTLTGWLTIIYGDPPKDSSLPPVNIILLTTDTGQNYELLVDFYKAFDVVNDRVQVTGQTAEGPTQMGDVLFNVADIQVVQAEGTSAVTGSQPWVNILCRFSGNTSQPHTTAWYTGLFGNTYPGLDHYWRGQSYNNMNIAGTGSFGWFVLPYNRAHYVDDTDPDDTGADLTALFNDCTAAADPSVNFSTYIGINMMFNDALDCCAWGGSRYATLDGVSKSFRVTWLPPWAHEHSYIAHEMGHGFTLPHSSGPADNHPTFWGVYNSQWDIMSASGGTCAVNDTTNYGGCIAQGTVSYHKDKNGWIAGSRKVTVSPGGSQTVTLERIDVPVSGTNPLMVQIPIGGSATHFYTVEARFRDGYAASTGYDRNIPGDAVIIMEVDTATPGPNSTYAFIVDAADGNDNVNDAGAMWVVGETYTDTTNNISVQVTAKGSSSFTVVVSNNATSGPPNDNFASARVIGGIPYADTTINTTNATTAGTDPTLPCGPGNQGTHSVWYRYTPPASGTINIDTNGSAYDTVLAVWTGTVSSLTSRGCDDDGGDGVNSSLNVAVTSGTTYYIEVVGYDAGDSGSLVLHVDPVCNVLGAPTLVAPPNASTTADEPIFFDWDAVSGAGHYQLQVDNNSGFTSPETDTSPAGSYYYQYGLGNGTYYWRARAYNTSLGCNLAGTWSSSRTVTVDRSSVGNDDIDDAYEIPENYGLGYTNTQTTNGATTAADDPNFNCAGFSGQGYSSVWYKFDAPNDKGLAINTFGSSYDTVLAIWTGNRGALRMIGCNDDSSSLQSRVQIGTLAGETYYVEIVGYNSSVNTLVLNVEDERPLLDPPVLAAPRDRSYFSNTNPRFVWRAVRYAVEYQIQISEDPSFGMVLAQGYVPTPYAYVGGGLDYGDYYWRVRAVDAYGDASDWSAHYKFTTTLLRTPRNGSFTTNRQPWLIWAPVPGAIQYEMELGGFGTYSGLATRVQPNTPMAYGYTQWRARVLTSDGWSNWTPYWGFDVTPPPLPRPTLISPARSAYLNDTTPTFTWGTVPGATWYNIQVDNHPSFTSAEIDEAPTGTTFTPTSPLPEGGRWYWRVRASNAYGVMGQWSAVSYFYLNQLPRPVLFSPPNGLLTWDNTPLLEWGTVSGATVYEIQIDDDARFSYAKVTLYAGTPEVTPPEPLPDGRWFWRVRAISTYGIPGLWSSPRYFRVDATAPDPPLLRAPADRSGTYISWPRLVWARPAGAVLFYVQLYDETETLLVNAITNGTTYAIPRDMPLTFGTYYWRVAAMDAVGNWSDWSYVSTFYITIMRTPRDGSFTTNQMPTFSWLGVYGANGYDFVIDNDPDFSSIIGWYYGLGRAVQPPAPLAYGTYYWKVRVDLGDGFGPWMPAWEVTITPPPPGRVALYEPRSGTLTNDESPVFFWGPAVNGYRYHIQIDNLSTFFYPEQDWILSPGDLDLYSWPMADGRWYWRVRAYNTYGVPGPWSAKWSLNIDTVPPDVPLMLSPVDGLPVVTNPRLFLRWERVPDAAYYEVQLDTDNRFPNPAINVGSRTAYKVESLLRGPYYYWRVRAVDRAGNASEWSPARFFWVGGGNTMRPSLVEADSEWVQRTGIWSAEDTIAASGEKYVRSSGRDTDDV
ncbi:MAG: hypothetical protein JXQ72_11545, partial [Anaerolineae bacterium]|nr:hypothetical protein [Anaerolineae bacterium]